MLAQIIDATSKTLNLSSLATQIGLFCLVTQLFLTFVFDKRTNLLPYGPYSTLPGFTAHQAVATPFMVLLSYYGWKEWEYDYSQYNATSSHEKLFASSNPNDFLLAYGTGAILLWDIPVGIFVPSMRDGIMFAHHIGMFAVAAVMSGMCSQGQMVGYYYVPFYFGVIETSSVFLVFVDQFHPKRKEWSDWLNCEENKNRGLVKFIHQINEICRVFFALSFIILRGIYFPYTSFFHCIPDIWKAYDNRPGEVPMWTGYFLIGALVLFSCLQSYWGLLVARQIKKALLGDDKNKKK